MFRELNWLSFGHMKSSRAGPLFGFKPAGCRALGKGSRGSRPGERPVKRGKSAVGCPLCCRPCARHVETPRSSPHRTSKTGNDDREGEEFFGQQKQSAKSAKNQVNRVKHFTNFHKTSMAGLLSLKKWTPE